MILTKPSLMFLFLSSSSIICHDAVLKACFTSKVMIGFSTSNSRHPALFQSPPWWHLLFVTPLGSLHNQGNYHTEPTVFPWAIRGIPCYFNCLVDDVDCFLAFLRRHTACLINHQFFPILLLVLLVTVVRTASFPPLADKWIYRQTGYQWFRRSSPARLVLLASFFSYGV